MNLEQQVAHLKSCITDLIGGYRQSNVSLEDWFNALWNAEQALNVHDCQDPAVGCSCSGSVRYPNPSPSDSPSGSVSMRHIYDCDLRGDGTSRVEAGTIGGELHLRTYSNGSHIYQVAVVPQGNVPKFLADIAAAAGLDELATVIRCSTEVSF